MVGTTFSLLVSMPLHAYWLALLIAEIIKAPLWDIAAKGPAAYPSNAAFVREHVAALLATSFPNLSAPQVRAHVCQ